MARRIAASRGGKGNLILRGIEVLAAALVLVFGLVLVSRLSCERTDARLICDSAFPAGRHRSGYNGRMTAFADRIDRLTT